MPRVVKTQVEFEGQFYDKYVVIEGEDVAPWPSDRSFEVIGKPQTRVDGRERVTGNARYTHDIQLTGMLVGKILRCPHPHARLRRIDTSNAEALSGVRAVLTPENTPEIPWKGGQTKLFDATLRYAGDEVACVIGDSEAICEDALELIEVEYERLPHVLDPERALHDDAPKVHESGNLLGGEPQVSERGDARTGFDEADEIVELTFRTQTALHNCMETHGSVAHWEGDVLTVWDSTQNIYGVRDALAKALDLPTHRVRVVKQYMGGGFGSKNGAGKYAVLAALAAKRLGRPVKVLLDRREENLAAGNRPSSVQTLKLGAKRDGTLTAIEHRSIIGVGAYAGGGPSPAGPTRRLYQCPNVRTEDHVVFTNTGPFSAFRAPGYVEGTFALESAMDELSKKLGIDPLELRLKNYAEIDQLTEKPYSTKGLKLAYEQGAELINWADRERTKANRSESGTRVGVGMASQTWGGNGMPPAYAWVKLNPDGTVVVITGTQDIGTGTKTAFAQIAAETLGIPIERIHVELGDTQHGLYSPLSAGSMTLASIGPAVRGAAEDARRQLCEVGAQVLDVDAADIEIHQGDLVHNGERTPIAEVLGKLGDFMITGKGARGPNPDDKSVNTFGAQFAQVSVDTETGRIHVDRLVAVHESGRVVNPLTIRSQLEGGIIQGLGFALSEARIDDERSGLVLSDNLESYKVPTVADVPDIHAEMVDLPDPEANNLGVKGVGEPPIIPTAAAIANAVADALGVRPTELPMTSARILQLLAQHRDEGSNHATV